jgi:hypothetical protein
MKPNTPNVQPSDEFLGKIINENPELRNFIKQKDSLNIQIIYTKIDRDQANKPTFTDYTFNADPDKYFYPASTVKMPGAFLALEKLNELKAQKLNRDHIMLTDSVLDKIVFNGSEAQQNETISQYIKQIFLVSDNDAFNKLYEFLGQEYIHEKLQQKRYLNSIIRHRLAVNMSVEQNRHTNAVNFYNKSGKFLYEQLPAYSTLQFNAPTVKMGKGFMRGDKLVNEPFDFSFKNRVALLDLHNMLRSVIFFNDTKPSQRFKLSKNDRRFLLHWMSALPKESSNPKYDTTEFDDGFAKFLPRTIMQNEGVRIFSKAGWAYGFLTDVAYVVDLKNNVEFMLSATILCNTDGVFNDDKYDFETIGYPFMKLLGETIYRHELQRKRKFLPDLSAFKFDYTKEVF